MSIDSKMTAIANHIRSIGGTFSTLTLDGMEANLYAIKSDIANAFSVIQNKNGSFGAAISGELADAIDSIPTEFGLNFEIIGGTTQPSYPENNTIWINTSTPVTGWQFGIEQPSGESGKVWICVGEHNICKFNALLENCIYIYPVFAKQYVNGTWVSVESLIYQSGEWKDWVSEKCIFNASQLNTSTASGMFTRPFSDQPRASEESGLIRLTNSGSHRVPFFIKDSYDLTNVSRIVIRGYSNYSDATVGISLNTNYQSGTYNPNYAVSKSFTSYGDFVDEKSVVLEVDDYAGNYYIAFAVDGLESINLFTIELLAGNIGETEDAVGITDVRIEEVV